MLIIGCEHGLCLGLLSFAEGIVVSWGFFEKALLVLEEGGVVTEIFMLTIQCFLRAVMTTGEGGGVEILAGIYRNWWSKRSERSHSQFMTIEVCHNNYVEPPRLTSGVCPYYRMPT